MDVTHTQVRTNGISMHVAQAGEGFPVVMCHGFPELWYSWRHQLAALSEAGYRAIAPDMRGYGGTDAPEEPAQYTMKILCADMAGLLDALGIERAVFVGHDWGGPVAWQMGVRYPERVAALVGLNTPYSPPQPGARTTVFLRDLYGLTDQTFYMRYFLTDAARREFEADIRTNLAKTFMPYTRAQDLWTFATVGGDGSGAWAKIPPPETFLTPEELDVYVDAFARTGIRGGLNWYRAADLNGDEVDPPAHTPRVPCLMITAENDLILRPEMAANMPNILPDVRIELIRNCSHWTQQERPAEVNRLLLEFLERVTKAAVPV